MGRSALEAQETQPTHWPTRLIPPTVEGRRKSEHCALWEKSPSSSLWCLVPTVALEHSLLGLAGPPGDRSHPAGGMLRYPTEVFWAAGRERLPEEEIQPPPE